jgi:hypothetical protein
MPDDEPAERLKKIVGQEKTETVWTRLYRLNQFATNLGLHMDDGYPPKKVVGKRRTRPS